MKQRFSAVLSFSANSEAPRIRSPPEYSTDRSCL